MMPFRPLLPPPPPPPPPVQTYYKSYFVCAEGPGCVLDPYDIVPISKTEDTSDEMGGEERGQHLVIRDASITKWQFVKIGRVEYVEVYTLNTGTILGPRHTAMYTEAMHLGGPNLDECLLFIIRDAEDINYRGGGGGSRRTNAELPNSIPPTPPPSGPFCGGDDGERSSMRRKIGEGRRRIHDDDDNLDDNLDNNRDDRLDDNLENNLDDNRDHLNDLKFRLIYRIPISAWETAGVCEEDGKHLFSRDCDVSGCTTVEIPKWLWHWGEEECAKKGVGVNEFMPFASSSVDTTSTAGSAAASSYSPRNVCDMWCRNFF